MEKLDHLSGIQNFSICLIWNDFWVDGKQLKMVWDPTEHFDYSWNFHFDFGDCDKVVATIGINIEQ
jgi:hypothetical protein